MKSITQNLKNGKTVTLTSPLPSVMPGHVLIKSNYSLISLGNEKMLVDFGKANILKKAKLQPDKTKLAISKIKTDGIVPTLNAILSKLNEPLPLGYSNSGIVYDVGEGVNEFEIGDLVVSNGPHAEYFNIPVNLCSKIPQDVDSKDAAFTVVASISLQSIRLLNPLIGETIYVFGLGIIGLIAVQILLNNGCNVVAVDYNNDRLKKAKDYGAEVVKLSEKVSFKTQVDNFCFLPEADGVIIATNTKSNEPIDLASSLSRKRGRIILVGDSGLKINRTEFYNKELTFQVSRSYGPGRYDKVYEQDGIDYPKEYVRWTVKRNFEAILELLKKNKLEFKSLISHELKLEDISQTYNNLDGSTYLGVIIKYGNKSDNKKTLYNDNKKNNVLSKLNFNTGFIGAGNYAKSILLPAFNKNGANIIGIASINGISAAYAGKKFNANYFSSDPQKIINDKNISNLVIATQHDSHFKYAKQGLMKNKNVFVEKPLCLNLNELEQLRILVKTQKRQKNFLTVGFNRRFSPFAKSIRNKLKQENSPKMLVMNINAGYLDEQHWTQSKQIGGGRIIGEAIHFIDLARFFCGEKIVNWTCSKFIGKSRDTCSIILNFKCGSVATINYISIGNKLYPKEKITVFCNGKIAEIDNFKKLKFYNWPGTKNKNLFIQNKGQIECVKSFLNNTKIQNSSIIPFDEIYEVTKTAIEISKFFK